MHSIILDRIRIAPEQLRSDNEGFILTLIAPEYREIAIQTFESMKKIVHSVSNTREDITDAFNKSLPTIQIHYATLNNIVLNSAKSDYMKLSESDEEIFRNIVAFVRSSSIGEENILKIEKIIEHILDYDSIIFGIMQQRSEQSLLEAVSKVDINDLLRTLSGIMLALSSLLVMIETKQSPDSRFKTLLDLGLQYSEILESYADTIDVLSNPKTMELLRKSE